MSKRLLIPSIILAVCLLFTSFFVSGTKKGVESASAAMVTSFDGHTVITKQGENNFFYAWGAPQAYKLMEWLVWGDDTQGDDKVTHHYTWRNPYENYAAIGNGSIHPGYVWGSILIWVSDRNGKITVDASFTAKNGAQSGKGDGVNYGVYCQSSTTLTTLAEEYVKDTTKRIVNQTFNVNKGDSVLLYCDAGPAHNNAYDGCNYSFKISYVESGTGYIAGEDLSKFLKIGTAGEITGYKDTNPGGFAADEVAAEEKVDSDETTVIIRGEVKPSNSTELVVSDEGLEVVQSENNTDNGCSSSVSALLPIGIISILTAGVVLAIKGSKRREN